jgi:Fic family protein
MADKESSRTRESIGLLRLIQDFNLPVPLPAVRSEAVFGARRTRIAATTVIEEYPRTYAPRGITGQLKFAMRYEPLDMSVLNAVFQTLDPHTLEDWVRAENTGVFARRAWYLYELLTGKTLDIDDVRPTGYVDLLDKAIHVTGPSTQVRRQRINDNLLGTRTYCPLIRRTDLLQSAMGSGLHQQAQELIESCDPGVLARAVNYLFTKETKSSYAIEGESPSADRSERFVDALSQAEAFDTRDPEAFVRLQNAIVDPRYAETGWRTVQSFVGQTRSDFTEHVHFACPKPDDVPLLMKDWTQTTERLHAAQIDAVCAAAAAAFGFVFIHPFEDGNGRIHRFLIHHMLARSGFTPDGLLLPVSAVMLRDRRAYDRVLNSYSGSVMPFVKYTFDGGGRMTVANETADLYRYWDATAFAEYLYVAVEQAIQHDLREEIDFLHLFDMAMRRTMDIVDMPDRRASLLVRLIMQNKGTLARGRRDDFGEISDHELKAIEEAIRTTKSTT